MSAYLEHVNITVNDIDGEIDFLRCICPDFKIRKDSTESKGKRWVHFGTDDFYIALQSPINQDQNRLKNLYDTIGVNHICWVVDDIEKIENKLLSSGYKNSMNVDHTYRKRIYFYSPSGVEWEIIQYFSKDPDLKNKYT